MATADPDNGYLYQQVVQRIRNLRDANSLRPGERLPSLRRLAAQLGISVPTVKQAYDELERLGWVEVRPQSGYYLRAPLATSGRLRRPNLSAAPVPVRQQRLIEKVQQAITQPGLVPLGISNPASAFASPQAFARLLRRVTSIAGPQAIGYGPMHGLEPLRHQLAHRYGEMATVTTSDQLIITNGAQEALTLALMCVARPGDVVAVESPTYFGLIELIESLGMMACEIPACPDGGVWLADLRQALDNQPIRACIFASSVNNPLGSLMPDATRRALVELVESRGVALIEDDVYGDLHFGPQRATPAQAWSKRGLVLTCSSFSKTAASGLRIGWLLPGRFEAEAKRLKSALSGPTPLLNQWAVHELLVSGDYDRNLKRLRAELAANKERMVAAVQRHFPASTRHSAPGGGCVLWLELTEGQDSGRLFEQALAAGISIAPGPIFSASGRYRHCLRLSFGLPWSERVEGAVARLGQLISGT